MLAVIAYYSGDRHLAVDLAQWVETLGGVSTHDCLLVVDKSTDSGGVIGPLQKAFRTVHVTSSEPAGAQGIWGKGTTDATAANEMWITAGNYVMHMLKCPWLWVEVDARPLRPTWLNEIEAEYQRARKPFMGALVNIPPHEPHMSGNGVYPANVAQFSLDMAIPNKIAWDYAGRRDTVGKQKAHFTQLIQHEYRVDGAPCTFPDRQSLSIIKPSTVIFHRCKDTTLTDRLREILEEKKGATGIAENINAEAPNPLEKENADLKHRLEEMERKITELVSRGRIPMPVTPVEKKIHPPPTHKVGKPMKKKYVMTEEHKAKIKASLDKRKREKELEQM